jgi:hypothetical protein
MFMTPSECFWHWSQFEGHEDQILQQLSDTPAVSYQSDYSLFGYEAAQYFLNICIYTKVTIDYGFLIKIKSGRCGMYIPGSLVPTKEVICRVYIFSVLSQSVIITRGITMKHYVWPQHSRGSFGKFHWRKLSNAVFFQQRVHVIRPTQAKGL